MRTCILFIAPFALLAGCKHEKPKLPTLEEANKVVDGAEASFVTGDAVRIMEHYAPDAVFFDPGINEPTNDRATATKWTEAFAATKPTNFSPGKRMIQILNPHTIVSSGIGSMQVTGKTGPATIRIRYTDVYQQQPDHSWLIVTEHLSKLPVEG